MEKLGWHPFFAQQISLEEMEDTPPVRVVEVHRSGLHVLGEGFDMEIPSGPEATVGDWLLLNRAVPSASRVLERKSLFRRRAAGTSRKMQLIAANVDTAFIVSSCNQDFNVARLERYIALAFESDVTPVILLTKADLCDDPAPYIEAASALSPRVLVVPLNALSDEPATKLADWCKAGQTLAFLGSSGVGKSTLVNALIGHARAATAPIREDDAKGRHTTSHRQLHFMPDGCAVLDTPGMRELQLADIQEGIDDLFADVASLALQCRFNDCQHETEPGCAVQAAVAAGKLDASRVTRWRKLVAEERFNTASLVERRADNKAFHKKVRAAVKHKKK